MCARDEVDKKNMETIRKVTQKYPKELSLYINSLSRKTSYTKMVYGRYVGRFLDYMKETLELNPNNVLAYEKIKPMDIDIYMETIRYDQNGNEKTGMYRNAQLAAINGFFKFLVRNEIIRSNPCTDVEKPKDNKEHEIITISDEDLEIIMNGITNGIGSSKAKATQKKWISRDIALVTLGVTTGLRVSAIVGIDIDDIHKKDKYIVVTEKGDTQKKIYIGDNTMKILKEWLKDRKEMVGCREKALFIAQGGRRMSVRAVENRFKVISEATGKRLTPHKMRATCATRLYEQTGDIYLVQQQLGHKNIENTKRYTKVSEERKREAANILDSSF